MGNPASREQLDRLYGALVEAGQHMLKRSRALIPYAAVLVAGGELDFVAMDPAGFRDAEELEAELIHRLAEEARAGQIVAGGWASTVGLKSPGFSGTALKVILESAEREPILAYVPYRRRLLRPPAFGEAVRVPGPAAKVFVR